MTVQKPPVSAFQQASDRIIAKTLLWALPAPIRPNHVTLVRFLLLPPLAWLLLTDNRGLALTVFLVAAATDFIDGAMARTRDQITNLGIVIDPVTDKLLIGMTLALLGWEYLIIKIIVIALAVELLAVLIGTTLWMRGPRGGLPGANVFGKIKMALQSIGGALFLLGAFLDREGLVALSLVFLWATLFFAVLSVARFFAITQPRRPT